MVRQSMLVAAGLVLGGCTVALDVPADATVACHSTSDCPAGYDCAAALGTCVKQGERGLPPTLTTPRLTPAAVRRGKAAVVEFSTTADLSRPPIVVLGSSQREAFAATKADPGAAYAFTADGQNLTEGEWPVLVTLVDKTGTVATDLVAGTLRVDFTPPALAGAIAVDALTVAYDQTAVLHVTSTEALAAPPTVELVWGSSDVTLTDVHDDGNLTWTYRYHYTGRDFVTPVSATITMTDVAGNVASRAAASVFFFHGAGPKLVDEVTQLRLLPPTGSLVDRVTRVAAGTTVEVFIAFDEPIVSQPAAAGQPAVTYPVVRVAGRPDLTFVESVSAGTTYVFDLVVEPAAMGLADGVYTLETTARDSAGNVNTVPLTGASFEVDTVPPLAPEVQSGGGLVFHRTPWGSNETRGLPVSRLVGQPASVEPCRPGEHGCTWLFVYAGPDLTTAPLLGKTLARDDGSFDFSFAEVDYPEVYVLAADPAGNLSGGQATRVLQGAWTATLQGKLPGNTLSNPNRVLRRPDSEAGPLGDGPYESELGYYGTLGMIDGWSTVVDAPLGWRALAASTATPPSMMSGAWAADSLRGTLLEVGGVTHSGCCSATTYDGVWTFDERGWTQLDATVAHPSRRGGHGMAFDSGRGRIVLFGGAEEVRSNTLPVKNDLWEWDGSRWEQRCDDAPASDHCTAVPPGRRFFAMAYDPVGARVVLFGGASDAGDLGDTWAWNGVDWRQITTTPAPSARSQAAMAFHGGTDALVLYGGTTGGGETWLLKGDTWTLVPSTGAAGPLAGHAMSYDPLRDRIVLEATKQVWEWNGSAWTVIDTSAGQLDHGVGGSLAFDAKSGRVVLWSGDQAVSNAAQPYPQSNGVWSWDGAAWTRLTPSITEPTTVAGIAWDDEAQLALVVAGNGAQTWTFDGQRLANPTYATAPAAGTATPSVTYDRARGVVVLFGGATDGETWEWGAFGAGVCGAGITRCWRNTIANGGGPSARTGAALTYDTRQRRVVLFGGKVNGAALPGMSGETWEYGALGPALCGANALCWALRASTGPEPRTTASFAYDELRGRAILFGGSISTSSSTPANCDGSGWSECSNTWSWDGKTWTKLLPTGAGPDARREAGFAYDRARGRILLFGGHQFPGAFQGGDRVFPEVWEWNGAAWGKLPPEGVGARLPVGIVSMTYDPVHRQAITASLNSSLAFELWAWRTGGGKANGIFALQWAAAEVQSTDVIGATVSVSGSSIGGPTTLGQASLGGLDASLWDPADGRWMSLGTARGATAQRASWVLPAKTIDRALGLDGLVYLRVRSVYGLGTLEPNAVVPAPPPLHASALSLDDVEVQLSYRHDYRARCGDGVVTEGEDCDAVGAGCDPTCHRMGSCGDGVLQALFEECDDGANNSDTLPNACRTSCRRARCGDGVIDAGEQCDDGDQLDRGNGCSETCLRNDVCGNGVTTGSEQCDDGNITDDGNGCTATCQLDPCCSAGAGCAPSSPIASCVCAYDAACCTGAWTATCVVEAQTLGCAVCLW